MTQNLLVSQPRTAVTVLGVRFRSLPLDTYGLLAVAIVTAVAAWRIIGNGVLVGQDAATQFYPWYSFLGEQLRGLNLPYWNPAQFSGAPFMADPQSGWTYLPAMAFFTVLPLAIAVPVFLTFHLALAGFGAYAFARALGIGPAGAAMAGVAYELSGPVYSRSVCCTAQLQVISWVPLLLLGAEMALHYDQWIDRVKWVVLAAVALSQIYASWLGQGSYYAVLLVSCFVVYRSFFGNQHGEPRLKSRIHLVASVLLPLGVLSLGLGAAGIVPRLEYNSLSNLAGGEYGGASAYAAVSGGWEAGSTAFSEMHTDPYYMGGVVISLATVAMVLTGFRLATPFFSATLVLTFLLSSAAETPLHQVAYTVLPKFESLHRHWPERLSLVSYIAFAILAGAAVDALPKWAGRWRLAAVAAIPVLIALAFLIGLSQSGDSLPTVLLVSVAFVVFTMVMVAFARSLDTRMIAVGALILVSVLDLLSANAATMSDGPYGGFHPVDLNRFYQAGSAARFLQYRSEEEVFRYLGYDPQLVTYEQGMPVYYRYQFHSNRARELAVNNRGTVYGIEDVQGYNPIQYQPYVDYLTALNGEPQDYHDANIGFSGLDSPLLDLLNARFVILPSAVPPESEARFVPLYDAYPTVFDDGQFRVIERESAMPRAWIVHTAVQADNAEAIRLVDSGEINPREVVAIDEKIPALEPESGTAGSATVIEQSPDRIVVEATSNAPGMLVLSEVDYPNWKAYVDGESVPVYKAYGLLRAIEIPAGVRTVEFRYEPTTEYVGFGITGISLVAVGCVLAAAYRRRRFSAAI